MSNFRTDSVGFKSNVIINNNLLTCADCCVCVPKQKCILCKLNNQLEPTLSDMHRPTITLKKDKHRLPGMQWLIKIPIFIFHKVGDVCFFCASLWLCYQQENSYAEPHPPPAVLFRLWRESLERNRKKKTTHNQITIRGLDNYKKPYLYVKDIPFLVSFKSKTTVAIAILEINLLNRNIWICWHRRNESNCNNKHFGKVYLRRSRGSPFIFPSGQNIPNTS